RVRSRGRSVPIAMYRTHDGAMAHATRPQLGRPHGPRAVCRRSDHWKQVVHALSFKHCTSEFARPPPFLASPKPVAMAAGSVVSRPLSSTALHAPFAAPAPRQLAPDAVPQ